MFDFFGDKRVPTLGGKSAKATPVASRKELRVVFFGVLAILAVLAWRLVGKPSIEGGALGEVQAEAPIAPMRPPHLAMMPGLPAPTEVDAQRAAVAAMLAAGEQPSLLTGLDATVMAWGEALNAADRERPPLPQRVSAEDFARRRARVGSALIVTGRLDDLADAGGSRRWLSLALDEGQYALALAPADGPELIINERVAVVGRFLGRLDAPVEGGAQEAPLILARTVSILRAEADVAVPEGMREFYGALRLPDDLYASVDDELPLVETRAYYYTVGRVKTEGATPEAYAGAVDANLKANDIHQRPDEFRGRPCVVRGVVYHAWEDEQIAADQPFDVRRVARILIFKRDIGPITENGVTSTKSVLRLFELAVVGDQPLPRPGEYIEATGRFVKWRAITVDRANAAGPDGLLGRSGKAYSMFFVVPSYRPLVIERVDWMPVKIALSILAGLIFIAMIAYIHRDHGAERRMRDSVLLLRQTRRRAVGQRPPQPPAPAAPPPAEPPPPGSP
jgi:hypothetical protein